MNTVTNKIDDSVEKLLANHLFNPTDKINWIRQLTEGGLSGEEASKVFKLAARKYHNLKAEKNQQKNKTSLGEALGFIGTTLVAFFVAQWAYIILVFVSIAVLGFVFGF